MKYEFKDIGDDDSQVQFIQKLDEKYKIEKKDESFIFNGDKKSVLTLKENPEIWVLKSGDKQLIEMFEKYIEKLKDILSENDIETSLFKANLQDFEKSEFGKLKKNKKSFLKFNENLKKIGVEEILINQTLHPFYKKVTLALNSNSNNIRNSSEKYSPKTDFLRSTFSFRLIKINSAEKVELIKSDETIIGEYYVDRNLIILNSNPIYGTFAEKNVKFLYGYKFNKVSTDKIALLNLTEKFFYGLKSVKSSSESNIKQNNRNIIDYSEKLVSFHKRVIEDIAKLEGIDKIISSGEMAFTEEIEKIKKLSYVKTVTPDVNGIKITFKDVWLKIRDFKRDNLFGKRTVYMGNMCVTILPDKVKIFGVNTIRSQHVSPGYCHPHVNDSNHPCFSDGDFQKKITKLIAEVKLFSVTQLIWIWLKECVNGQTYSPGHCFYDDRLRRGYPVFEGIERIKINDPKRIKTGEQIELTKDEKYDENLKKYKELVI